MTHDEQMAEFDRLDAKQARLIRQVGWLNKVITHWIAALVGYCACLWFNGWP